VFTPEVCSQQVGELAVGEGVLLEVRTQPFEELVLADPGHQLLEGRGALRVGDPVEVHLDGLEVVVVRGDRVGRGQLVLPVGPVLARVGEAGPGVVVLGGLGHRVVRGPLGEGLVEPEVVPPAHRDEVPEPHVRHLVQHGVGALLVERVGLPRAREVLVAERHARGVLHRAHVVLRHVGLVVLPAAGGAGERVGVVEGLLEEREALLGDLDQLVDVEELRDRLAAVVAEPDLPVRTGVRVVDGVVLTGHQCGDVRRHAVGGREGPRRRAVTGRDRLGGLGVGDHRPVRRCLHGEREDRLQVRLLERRVDAPGVGHLELRVQVDALVGRVDEAVQPLTAAAVGAVRDDPELVVGLEAVEPDPAVGVHLGDVQGAAVERDLGDRGADQVGERRGAGLAAGEPDHGRRAEGRIAGGEVEVDRVRLDVEECGAGLRLLAGEVGSRHGVMLARRAAGAETACLARHEGASRVEGSRMPEVPWEMLSKSQRAAVGLFTDTVAKLVDMGRTGVTRPDELLREVTAMASAIGDLASSTARPLEYFISSQKQLAESMAAFAVLQRQMAEVVETVAASHAAVVDALELMSSPVLGVASKLRAEDSR
jgi:hypothetical protein